MSADEEGEVGGAAQEEIDVESEEPGRSGAAAPDREGKNHLLFLNAFLQSGSSLPAEGYRQEKLLTHGPWEKKLKKK